MARNERNRPNLDDATFMSKHWRLASRATQLASEDKQAEADAIRRCYFDDDGSNQASFYTVCAGLCFITAAIVLYWINSNYSDQIESLRLFAESVYVFARDTFTHITTP